MRRRWTAVVAVGAVVLFAGLLFLLPPRDDGLDWIRKYARRESRSDVGDFIQTDMGALIVDEEEVRWVRYDFHFQSPLPDVFLREFDDKAHHAAIANSDLVGRYRFGKTPSGYSLVVEKGFERTWLDKQWILLRKRFGL